MVLEGIDIYEGDGAVEWHRVRAAGKSFAFVRAAYGTHADGAAAHNLAGARAAGLVCGLYHFFRQPLDTIAQIKTMIDAAHSAGLHAGDLVPVLDVEDNPNYDGNWNAANNASYIAALHQWLDALQTEFGKPPIIYTRASFWDVLGDPGGFNRYPLWVANYGVSYPKLPSGWASYAFWQYSESGTVDGAGGHVDLDRFNGSADDLSALTL